MDCPVEEDLLEGQYSIDETVRYTEECLARLPHDPRFFTTSVAVADLEAVRVALGYPALNLYGISYGTRVAQHFARRYPEVTRTLVLDGVVPPQLSLGPEIATEAQHALERIFDRCAEDDACATRYGDLDEKFAGLKERLSAKKVKVKSADPVSGEFDTIEFGADEMAIALRLLAYDARTIALVPLLVSEAADGNYRPLLAQFQMTLTSLSEALAMGMHNAVMCSEDVPFYDENRFDVAAIENSYIGPVQLESLQAICSVWPAGPVDGDFKQPLATDTPTLMLSGDADPITPPRYADLAASSLKRAWLITGTNQGHGQINIGCMPRLVASFVTNQSVDGFDTSCIEDSFVMPFFLDYSGPAP
jgi:pimeloyl-ACP methyl ester carboxylesterase